MNIQQRLLDKVFLAFVVIKDSTIQICDSYKIAYKDSVITKITKWTDTIKHKITINKDCTLGLDISNVKYYDSNDFKINNFNYKMYSLIDKDFLSLTNDLKIDRLEKILLRLNEKK